MRHGLSAEGKFGHRAKLSGEILEQMFPDKLKVTLFSLDNDPINKDAFEIYAKGTLVHSQKKRNHGYLDSASEEHKAALKNSIELAMAGKAYGMVPETEYSQIAEETKKKEDENKAREDEEKAKVEAKKKAMEDAAAAKIKAAEDAEAKKEG